MKLSIPLLAGVVYWAPLAAAAAITSPTTNSIKFINHCPYDLFYWTIGPRGSKLDGADNSHMTIPRYGTTIQPMINTERLHGGIVLKLRDFPKYQVKPAGIIQVEYNFLKSRDLVWYDLSVIDCDHNANNMHPSFCPLIDGGIKMYIPGADPVQCPAAWCSHGKCENVYLKHGSWYNEPSFMYRTGVNIVVETCTDRAGPQTFQAFAVASNATASGSDSKGSNTTVAPGKSFGTTPSAGNITTSGTAHVPAGIFNATIPVSNITSNATAHRPAGLLNVTNPISNITFNATALRPVILM